MHDHLKLSGCRHDILGHYLKAIGLLRVLAKCAEVDRCDSDAEGWWNDDDGAFYLRSEKYGSEEKLIEFFEKYYRPTPVFAAWNRDSGLKANDAAKLSVQSTWQAANDLSEQVVSIADRKKPQNKDKLIVQEAFALYRNAAEDEVAQSIDAVSAPFLRFNSDNDLFMSKGVAGRSHILRTYWGYVLDFNKIKKKYTDAKSKVVTNATRACPNIEKKLKIVREAFVTHLLTGENPIPVKGKGTPFFPDAIKTYNVGSGWVEESFPFTALDYILAVEGAFAMRGSVSRTLGANTRRFAAFPFVFDSDEELVDDANKVKGTASSFWFPLWERPATYAEISSFICDAQARLPRKEVQFSAEFLRALHSQGVDAGFSGWQEFRFRMKGSRVPWVTAGNFSEAKYSASATLLNRALEPFDASHFLDQFKFIRKGSDADSHSPHKLRAALNAAIETAVGATTADSCLAVLCEVFKTCKKMALSKTFREKSLRKHPPRFFEPLPMKEWNELLDSLKDIPEFEIARAVASIVGQQPQLKLNGEYSKVQPLLGSLLPLKLGKNGWYLPSDKDRSNQAVWSGTNLCRDLAAVLQRRYMDSEKDDYPAIKSVFPAQLENILAFLNGELNDHKIARWIEALSLIGWHFEKRKKDTNEEAYVSSPDEDDEKRENGKFLNYAIPLPYAALRLLLDSECAYQKPEDYKRRRSLQPVAQLCTCSPHALEQAIRDALRWLGIWGVENPWGKKERQEQPLMRGAYIVRVDDRDFSIFDTVLSPERLVASVVIPLAWRDRWQLRRLVTLPTNS